MLSKDTGGQKGQPGASSALWNPLRIKPGLAETSVILSALSWKKKCVKNIFEHGSLLNKLGYLFYTHTKKEMENVVYIQCILCDLNLFS